MSHVCVCVCVCVDEWLGHWNHRHSSEADSLGSGNLSGVPLERLLSVPGRYAHGLPRQLLGSIGRTLGKCIIAHVM